MISATIYLILHSSEGPLDVTMQKIAYIIAGYLGLLLIQQSFAHRAEMLQLVLMLNKKSLQNLQRSNHAKYRSRRNFIYLIVVTIPISFVILPLVPVPLLIETFRNGDLYFKNVFPFDKTPFSASNYVQAFVYYFIYVFIFWFCMPYLAVIFENFLQIVLNFSILADDLRGLRNGEMVIEEVEFRRLRACVIEFNDLKR